MKYLITESQKDKVALKWMNDKFSPDQLEEFTNRRYPHHLFYKKNGKIVMFIDNKNRDASFSYDDIYSVLRDFFGYDFDEYASLMDEWLKQAFDLEGFSPLIYYGQYQDID